MQHYYYKSPPETFSASSNIHFKGWIPRIGPNGKRLVIDGFFLCADWQDITVATTAIQGEDWWRSFQRIIVEQTDGRLRWNALGDASRVLCYLLDGPNAVHEYADSAVSANQDIEVMVYIPMSKRRVHNPTDFAMPVEAFKKLTIQCASLATSGNGLGISGGTVTVTTGEYYVIAKCHEEKAIVLHAEDVVAEHLATNTGTIRVDTGGRCQDLTLWAQGASGGASLANLTDVRIDNLMNEALARDPDLVEMYKRDLQAATNLNSTIGSAIHSDPHGSSLACPVLWSNGARVLDGPLSQELIVRLTNSVSSLYALTRTVVPKSATLVAGVKKRYGLSDGDFRVKTAKKTKRDQGRWTDEDLIFLPMVARDPRQPARIS